MELFRPFRAFSNNEFPSSSNESSVNSTKGNGDTDSLLGHPNANPSTIRVNTKPTPARLNSRGVPLSPAVKSPTANLAAMGTFSFTRAVQISLERVMYEAIGEFLGVFLICSITQQGQIQSDSLSRLVLVCFGQAVAAGIAFYNFPSGLFHPFLVVHRYFYELFHGGLNWIHAIGGAVICCWTILVGVTASFVSTFIIHYQTGDYGLTGVPVISSSVTNNAIMTNMFVSAFIFSLIYCWQILRTEEADRHTARLGNEAVTPAVSKLIWMGDHSQNVYNAQAMAAAYFIGSLYSFNVSGGNINIYATAPPAWLSGNAHGVAQEALGQMLGIAASTVFILIACLLRKHYKFASV